jgi:hypothetical protein
MHDSTYACPLRVPGASFRILQVSSVNPVHRADLLLSPNHSTTLLVAKVLPVSLKRQQ